MAWTKRTTSNTTGHSCGGPVFGKRTAGCPRCDELIAGAAPVAWNRSKASAAIRSHNCALAGCGNVCIAFDW